MYNFLKYLFISITLVFIVGCGSSGEYTVLDSLEPNINPIAKAGPDQTLNPYEEVLLDGSASRDSDGSIVSYKWTDSNNAVLGKQAQVIVLPSPADHETVFTLTVTDDDGATHSDSMSTKCIHNNRVKIKKTGQTISYANNDDGYYQKGSAPNYTRNDRTEVVTDHITGLEWQDNEDVKKVTMIVKFMVKHCAELVLDGRGWRLPTRKELGGLINLGNIDPAIDSTFLNTASSCYWSSTPSLHLPLFYDASDDLNVWSVNFIEGKQNPYGSTSCHVRCVRVGK